MHSLAINKSVLSKSITPIVITGTCFIQKIYALSSSLLQGKHFPLPHFASIFFAYLWSFHWPNYIVTLPRYFSWLPHLNIPTGAPSDELDKNSQRTWLSQGHYGFHSFPVVDWFCLFIYLWVLTFPLLDCSEFGNFVITLI
jgi:hypothetical protein